jgi:hypothetical protein
MTRADNIPGEYSAAQAASSIVMIPKLTEKSNIGFDDRSINSDPVSFQRLRPTVVDAPVQVAGARTG